MAALSWKTRAGTAQGIFLFISGEIMTHCTTLRVTQLITIPRNVAACWAEHSGNFLGCQHTRSGQVQPPTNQHTQILPSRAALNFSLPSLDGYQGLP